MAPIVKTVPLWGSSLFVVDHLAGGNQCHGKSDCVPPSVPQGLTATSISASQINLTWNASNDSESGVIGYYVYRGSTQVLEPVLESNV